MTKQEYHDLLIRLDERTRNIWQLVEKLETHQKEQNGSLQNAIDLIRENTSFRLVFMRAIKITGSVIGSAILAWFGKLLKDAGWW
jgi:hypothetical protein